MMSTNQIRAPPCALHTNRKAGPREAVSQLFAARAQTRILRGVIPAASDKKMNKERTDRQKTTGRFAKGTSGNPAGRPPGSRNRASVLIEQLLDAEVEQLIQKVLERASAGDTHALLYCLNRAAPPRKERTINLRLPPLETAQQISSAISAVVEAVGAGQITPGEGETLTHMLAVKAKLAQADIERRVEHLEQVVAARKNQNSDPEATDPNGTAAD